LLQGLRPYAFTPSKKETLLFINVLVIKLLFPWKRESRSGVYTAE